MNHALKVIIGFTFMIAIGIGALFFIDKETAPKEAGLSPVNTGAGCAAKGEC